MEGGGRGGGETVQPRDEPLMGARSAARQVVTRLWRHGNLRWVRSEHIPSPGRFDVARNPDLVTVVLVGSKRQKEFRDAVLGLANTHSGPLELLLLAAAGSPEPTAPELPAPPFAEVRTVQVQPQWSNTRAINFALPEVSGSTIVILGSDCVPGPGWLPPLLTTLEDPAVGAVGSLILNPTRTIHAAGYGIPAAGGLPYRLLEGLPAEDAASLVGSPLTAVDGRAMAMRTADLVELNGFDPGLRSALGDVDLCLRIRQGGHHVVLAADSVVTRVTDRQVPPYGPKAVARFLGRWPGPPPQADDEIWLRTSFRVARYEIEGVDQPGLAPAPIPVLARRLDSVREMHVLRWAIKNPARADNNTHLWGDTNYARDLADALRRLGQEVVVDLRPEFQRATGYLDDVVVVLRGVQRHRPSPGQINLLWVISHPELVSREELTAYTHVFAAGPVWAERMSREWGIPITPLLQATNPRLFHPDRAEPDTGHRVLFVGNARTTPRPVVMDAVASGEPVDVYGLNWRDWIPAEAIRATELPNAELGAAYRAAGIVLNDHWEGPRREGFVCNRLFDAVAAGARVISDPVEGIDELFGRCVQVSQGPADMKRLLTAPDLDAVFGDEQDRLRASERVRENHSFDRRAEELLRVALTYRHLIQRPD